MTIVAACVDPPPSAVGDEIGVYDLTMTWTDGTCGYSSTERQRYVAIAFEDATLVVDPDGLGQVSGAFACAAGHCDVEIGHSKVELDRGRQMARWMILTVDDGVVAGTGDVTYVDIQVGGVLCAQNFTVTGVVQ
jgi:hypothetical protein